MSQKQRRRARMSALWAAYCARIAARYSPVTVARALYWWQSSARSYPWYSFMRVPFQHSAAPRHSSFHRALRRVSILMIFKNHTLGRKFGLAVFSFDHIDAIEIGNRKLVVVIPEWAAN